MILILIVIVVILFIFNQPNKTEHFTLFNKTEQKKVNDDSYMDFLINLDDKLKSELKCINNENGLKLCNDRVANTLKTEVSDFIFKEKVHESVPQGHLLDTQTTNDTVGIPFDPSKDIKNPNCLTYNEYSESCLYKAISLSEQTNPFMYITSSGIRFPPLWIGPYKNSALPQEINIHRYNFLYDCCNNGTT